MRIIPIPPPKKGIKGIEGKTKFIGEATIQITFCSLNLINDVDFEIVYSDAPSIFSNIYVFISQ